MADGQTGPPDEDGPPQGPAAQWLAYAERDLAAARDMARLGHDAWALTVCQPALEKMLKALLAQRGEEPPRTHSLPRLAGLLGLELTETQITLLTELTNAYLLARYPGEVPPEAMALDERAVSDYVSGAEEAFAWLQTQLDEQT